MIQDNAVGSMGRRCNLRYRPYMEQNWTEADSELVGEDTFTLQDPRPHTLYLFQVRCAIMEEGVTTVASDWSRPYSARSAEAAPVGALDVWADAGGGEAPALVWKELPPALSHSAALWYEVRQCGADRSSWVGNRTKEAREGCREAADRGGGGSCCRLYLARCPGVTGVMTEVREVSVSAVNRLGRTQPTHLLFENKDLPAPQSVSYTMEKGNLRVSWVPPPDPSEHVQEFVVQRKEAGLNCSRGFDWIRVNATQRSAILTGVFQNYTPYTVSVFALYSSGHSPPASVTSYTLEGVPPAVPGLSVSQISFSKATVAWEPIPLRESRGRVRRYQVGWVEVGGPEDQQQNITVSGQCQAQVSGLAPGRQYQLWVSAETQVGQGPRSHISLTTYERNDLMVMVLCIVGVIIVFAVFLLCKQPRRWPLVSVCCCEKIPDPRNSRLYGVQKDTSLLQEPKPWLWASSSLSESFQKICQLEVIPSPEHTDTGGEERRSTGEGGEEGEWEREREREGGEEEEEDEWGRARKESYSEMKDGEVLVAVGPGAIPPQTPPFFSDYEKHFMPSPLEV
ncbi:I12R2 protein, partial [Amia calva]|nr:I12R2 protein [Amia calva]